MLDNGDWPQAGRISCKEGVDISDSKARVFQRTSRDFGVKLSDALVGREARWMLECSNDIRAPPLS
jgi:hypothetical protein